jgi:hypothetical protein
VGLGTGDGVAPGEGVGCTVGDAPGVGVAGGTSCALAHFKEAIAKLVMDNEAIENSKNFGKLNFRFICPPHVARN